MSCKVGIEGFVNAFEHFIKNHGLCVVRNTHAIDYTSPALITYYNTVCSFAEACSKANTLGTSFLSCLQNTFCTYAPESVKATGQIVYQANQESLYNSAVAALPWIGVSLVVSSAAAGILDGYAPKSKVANSMSFIAKAVGVLSGFALVGTLNTIRSE